MPKENFRLDLVGVAAPRSATTWLAKCLGEHLNAYFADEIKQLELLLGKDLDVWKS